MVCFVRTWSKCIKAFSNGHMVAPFTLKNDPVYLLFVVQLSTFYWNQFRIFLTFLLIYRQQKWKKRKEKKRENKTPNGSLLENIFIFFCVVGNKWYFIITSWLLLCSLSRNLTGRLYIVDVEVKFSRISLLYFCRNYSESVPHSFKPLHWMLQRSR